MIPMHGRHKLAICTAINLSIRTPDRGDIADNNIQRLKDIWLVHALGHRPDIEHRAKRVAGSPFLHFLYYTKDHRFSSKKHEKV